MHHHTTTNWRRSKNERRGGRGALFRQRSRANEARIRRSRAGKTSTNSTEREIQKSSSFFISFFFLPSKSWLEKVPFWPSSSPPKNHPHFLAFLFYQLIRKSACKRRELTTFPLSLFPSPFDDARNITQASPPSPSAAGGGSTATTKTTKTKTKKQCSSVYRGVRQRPWGR